MLNPDTLDEVKSIPVGDDPMAFVLRKVSADQRTRLAQKSDSRKLLEEIDRPVFPYPGAWFELGNGVQLHLVVRADATLRRLIAVMFTSSSLDVDITRAYDLGANAFIVKPNDYVALVPILRSIHDFWLATNRPSPEFDQERKTKP